MLPGISPPPPFLVSPGTPAIPWPRWLRLFENFTLASGASELSAARRRALLLHCLGPEGQRIFDALPPPPPSNAPDHPPAHPSAGTAPLQTVTPSATTAAVGTTEIKQADAELAQPPDEYDAAVQAMAGQFSATCNVRVERHRFRDRRQLHGEPISEFALALRELASSCNFAAQADTNLCDQFVAGVTCPRLRERLLLEGDALTFDRAVEIALLREQVQRESEALGTAPVDRVVPQHNRGRNPAGRRRHVRQSSSTDRRSTPSSSRSGFVRPPAPEIVSAVVPYSVNTNVCGNYGAQNCQPSACAARGRACFACGRRGHFQQYCRNSRRGRGRRPARVAEIVSEEDAESVVNILTVHSEKPRKKDGSIRICVDLREDNKAVVVDSFPLPHTEELLHALNGARYFSRLDLASAYYQTVTVEMYHRRLGSLRLLLRIKRRKRVPLINLRLLHALYHYPCRRAHHSRKVRNRIAWLQALARRSAVYR
ncbi:uncharacterized protein LOC144147123 [Haemaphysalis longicornis]